MTLQRYLPLFVPGSDQPGDWSNRQTAIHITKDEKMEGGIIQHLQNSIHLIKNLYKISNYSLWQKEIAKKELQCLQATLTKYKR